MDAFVSSESHSEAIGREAAKRGELWDKSDGQDRGPGDYGGGREDGEQGEGRTLIVGVTDNDIWCLKQTIYIPAGSACRVVLQ